MEVDRPHLGILVALDEEQRPLMRRLRGVKPCPAALADRNGVLSSCRIGTMAGKSVAVVRSGMGRDRAEPTARAFIESLRPQRLLVMGFCGGMTEWAGPADLVVAEYVMDWPDFPGTSGQDQPDSVLHPDPKMARIANAVTPKGVRMLSGGILSVGPVTRTTDLKGYHGPRAARCRGLDMETASAARVAADAGIPWMVVRAVTDPLKEDLPLCFADYTTPSGALDRWRIAAAAISQPMRGMAILRLARHASRAARNLAAFAEKFVAAT